MRMMTPAAFQPSVRLCVMTDKNWTISPSGSPRKFYFLFSIQLTSLPIPSRTQRIPEECTILSCKALADLNIPDHLYSRRTIWYVATCIGPMIRFRGQSFVNYLPSTITVVTSRHMVSGVPPEHCLVKFSQEYVVADYNDVRDTFRKDIRRINDKFVQEVFWGCI